VRQVRQARQVRQVRQVGQVLAAAAGMAAEVREGTCHACCDCRWATALGADAALCAMRQAATAAAPRVRTCGHCQGMLVLFRHAGRCTGSGQRWITTGESAGLCARCARRGRSARSARWARS